MRAKEVYCISCAKKLSRKKIDGCHRQICVRCGWINYKNPLPVTVALAVNSEKKILIAKRAHAPGLNRWAFPGGFVENGESAEAGCLRELREETGIRGKIIRLLGVYPQQSELYGSLLVVGYEVSAVTSKIRVSKEIKEAMFVNNSDIPVLPFRSHKQVLEAYLRH
ncbi:MAG: NUDIX hydrolase [Candidatus Omnitrophota bacterium]